MSQNQLEQYVVNTIGSSARPRLLRELAVRGVVQRIFALDGAPELIVVEGPSLQHFPRDGMSDADLELQLRGERWLREQNPVAMLRPMPGQTEFLDYHEETRLEDMVEKGAPEDYRFLEGWVLLARAEFLAMGVNREGTACVLSDTRGCHFVAFPEASSFRRLSYVVGKHFSID